MKNIEEYLAKAEEARDRDAFAQICRAFTQDEWQIVLNTVPSKALANELVRRAELGGQAIKKIQEAYDSVWN